jgi:hypothetical protein
LPEPTPESEPASVLLWYGGVALSVQGQNFLVPVDLAPGALVASTAEAMVAGGALPLGTLARWLAEGAAVARGGGVAVLADAYPHPRTGGCPPALIAASGGGGGSAQRPSIPADPPAHHAGARSAGNGRPPRRRRWRRGAGEAACRGMARHGGDPGPPLAPAPAPRRRRCPPRWRGRTGVATVGPGGRQRGLGVGGGAAADAADEWHHAGRAAGQAAGAAAVASFLAAVLTDIYLCDVCSCQNFRNIETQRPRPGCGVVPVERAAADAGCRRPGGRGAPILLHRVRVRGMATNVHYATEVRWLGRQPAFTFVRWQLHPLAVTGFPSPFTVGCEAHARSTPHSPSSPTTYYSAWLRPAQQQQQQQLLQLLGPVLPALAWSPSAVRP